MHTYDLRIHLCACLHFPCAHTHVLCTIHAQMYEIQPFMCRHMKYELVRSNLKKYGIRIQPSFVGEAQRAFRHVCCTATADMNQFAAVMQRLGCNDCYINDRIFRLFDEDSSGRVDSNEFCMGLIAAMDKALRDRICAYFHLVDTDGDGTLDRQELEVMLTTSGKFEEGDISKTVELIFNEVNVQEGCSIAIEEFSSTAAMNPKLLKIFDMCFS